MADEPPTPRKGGRPPAREPGAIVSTWLPASDHDRLLRLAARRDETLSALVRRLLTPPRAGK